MDEYSVYWTAAGYEGVEYVRADNHSQAEDRAERRIRRELFDGDEDVEITIDGVEIAEDEIEVTEDGWIGKPAAQTGEPEAGAAEAVPPAPTGEQYPIGQSTPGAMLEHMTEMYKLCSEDRAGLDAEIARLQARVQALEAENTELKRKLRLARKSRDFEAGYAEFLEGKLNDEPQT